MASITLKGNEIHTCGEIPKVGAPAPTFQVLRQDLSEVGLDHYAGKRKILNIFPSIDTPVCATSLKTFHQKAANKKDTMVLNISMDLPFAAKRFCGSEGVETAETLSAFRSSFGKDYGLLITDGPLKGLFGRAVLVLDENNKVMHAELVPEIAQEPNYDQALGAL